MTHGASPASKRKFLPRFFFLRCFSSFLVIIGLQITWRKEREGGKEPVCCVSDNKLSFCSYPHGGGFCGNRVLFASVRVTVAWWLSLSVCFSCYLLCIEHRTMSMFVSEDEWALKNLACVHVIAKVQQTQIMFCGRMHYIAVKISR